MDSAAFKKLSRYESEISSILGMVVVAAIAVFIFLFVKRFMPKPSISPTADNVQQEDLLKKSDNGKTYTVKAGQGLTQIAVEIYKDKNKWLDIAKANDIKAPYRLEKGQELKLPDVEAQAAVTTEETTAKPEEVAPATPAATPVAMVKTAEAPSTTATTEPASGTYVIQKGDSLWKIAVAQYGNGYMWTKVYQANKKLIGSNPGRLFVGNTLTLPSTK